MGPENNGGIGVKERISYIYSSLVSCAGRLPKQVLSGTGPDVRQLKRLIQHCIDMITDDEPVLLGMVLNKNLYEYEYRHIVNVCILSISLGHKIGLTKKELVELGLAAFLYDVGKFLLPEDVLNRDGVYNRSDRRIMEKHPVQGMKVFFSNENIDKLSRAAIVSFEHHLNYNLSGYPQIRHISDQDFYARIVAIAESYDALTSTRSYAEGTRSPDYAVRTLLSNAGSEFDPVLVKFFVSMMGIYPIGSMVVLDSGEVGIVIEPHGVLLRRPRVLVISEAVKPFVADLSKRDNGGRYLRTVKRTLDPNEYKIDYASYFHRPSKDNQELKNH
jgi:HD-GYP domain-containing protein (c-di-GMP phosphodiesterase class II)